MNEIILYGQYYVDCIKLFNDLQMRIKEMFYRYCYFSVMYFYVCLKDFDVVLCI